MHDRPSIGTQVAALRQVGATIPAPMLLLGAIISVQIGAATATGLFHSIGAAGTVFLRMAAGAIVLAMVWRPTIRGRSRSDVALVMVFGLTLAGMNLTFFEAIARIPLGVAVTLEFAGPMSVALLSSRHALDIIWALLAAAGIVSLAPIGGTPLNPTGVAFGLCAGALWAAYILLNVRVGQAFAGGRGLSLAMLVATVALLPGGMAAGHTLLNIHRLVLGGIVGLLSSVVPFSLEMEALRRVPPRVYSLVISLEPVVAALIGFAFLSQGLSLKSLLAIALVSSASIGSTIAHAREGPM